MEDILSTTKDTFSARPAMRPDAQAHLAAVDRAGESRMGRSRLGAVDLAAGGTVAVTRPSMPRIFRVLLALTGVRI